MFELRYNYYNYYESSVLRRLKNIIELIILFSIQFTIMNDWNDQNVIGILVKI